jgi:anti-sigma factor ChrR (cupin superfamily)
MSSTSPADDHPSEEALRTYAAGCLEPAEAADLESHLAACTSCCDLVAGTAPDSFLTLLRLAHATAAAPPPEGHA